MKISLKWLSEYVDVSEFFQKPERLDSLLTAAGLEVEGIENFSEQFKHVVVGQVKELGRHPDADKLTLCQVEVGKDDIRQIVCGAKNHNQGDKVAVALVGAILPGDFKIKKSKIRGVESFGMMCSEVELGLADESPGILILPENAPVGKEFAEYQGLDDVLFELSVTPNRADCLSHIGLAREIACLLGQEVKLPSIDMKEVSGDTGSLVKLTLRDSELCPRYAGRAIRGVKVGPSPAWLRSRLEAVGVNTINNIVDVTNYVMMELGQPLHAFDVSFLEGGEIIVDRSQKAEKFKTLDGTEIDLTGDELTIRDAKKPVALAGVVGGLNSGVVESTVDVFVESAHFVPKTVRKTSRRFGIETDSAYRFARGTDPDGVVFAMNRACSLIQEVAGGVVAEDHHDAYPSPEAAKEILARKSYVEDRLGYPVDMGEFESWMKRLGCKVLSSSADEVKVEAPAFRWDLDVEVDLVEEFARLNGYDKIPERLPPLVDSPSVHDKTYLTHRRLMGLVKQEGYQQVVNYGFTESSFTEKFLGDTSLLAEAGVECPWPAVKLQNPLSEDLNIMRVSLLPGMFKNLLHNYRHGGEFGRQFEVGFVFGKNDKSYFEPGRLALSAWGQRELLWQKEGARPVVYDLKATIENLLQKLNAKSWQWRVPAKTPEFLHPGQTAGLFYEGRMVGFVGALHPGLCEEYKLRTAVALAEIDINKLMRGQPRLPKLKVISKYPAVTRDFAFLLSDTQNTGDIVQHIKKAGGEGLQSVDIFDEYRGENVEAGKRSVAFRLVYQDQEGTLSEEKLTELQKSIIDGVVKKFSVEVR